MKNNNYPKLVSTIDTLVEGILLDEVEHIDVNNLDEASLRHITKKSSWG